MIKKRYKHTALLMVVTFLLIGSYLTVALIPFSSAHKNVQNKTTETEAKGDKTAFYYEFDKYYGAHDWIADSALRLLLADESWRENFTWILREDPYNNPSNPRDNIPFKDFDGKGTINTRSKIRAWSLNKDNMLGDVSTKQGVTIKGYDKALKTQEIGGRKWLHALRYTSLLHGTMIIDYLADKTSYAVSNPSRGSWYLGCKNPYFPSVKTVFGSTRNKAGFLNREYGTKVTKSLYFANFHKVYFLENTVGRFRPDLDNAWAADGSKAAGKDAQYFLEWEVKKSDFKGGGKEHQPKYMAACLSLGIISAYIADLSIPSHVLSAKEGEGCIQFDYDKSVHAKWEIELNKLVGFSTDTFLNGGPSWENIDPRRKQDGYEEGLSRKKIFALPPYAAAAEMAHITFTGYDPDNNFANGQSYPINSQELKNDYEYAAVNMEKDPSVDGEAKAWGLNLLKWSVYYTACAWAWVMDQVKKGGHYIGDNPMQIEKALEPAWAISEGSQYKQPLEGELWTSAHTEHYEQYVPEGPHYEKAAQGMMMAAGLLVPTIALVLIPIMFPVVKDM